MSAGHALLIELDFFFPSFCELSLWRPNAAARVSAGATVSTDQYLCERPFAGDRVSGAAIIFLVPKTSPYDTLRRNLERERARLRRRRKRDRQKRERHARGTETGTAREGGRVL